MKILDIVPPGGVLDGLRSATKEAVLRELSEAVCRLVPALSPDHLTSVLMEREALGSTGIGEGVAIPHGKVAGIDRLVAVFGRSLEGVQFASLDGKPARLFFLVVAPENNSAGMHLKALARISRLVKDERFRRRLLDAAGVEGLTQALREEDERI
jgi:PTS system nitrogen regulatory IIA component